MSIYSGFATRNQESFYNKLIEKLVQLLAEKVISSIKGYFLKDEKSWTK